MSRPRPERVDAALAAADAAVAGVLRGELNLDRVADLAAEVRALRVDVQMAEESTGAWQRVANGFRADLHRIARGNAATPDGEEADDV